MGNSQEAPSHQDGGLAYVFKLPYPDLVARATQEDVLRELPVPEELARGSNYIGSAKLRMLSTDQLERVGRLIVIGRKAEGCLQTAAEPSVPDLRSDQADALLQLCATGEAAQRILVVGNIRWVKKYMQRYIGRGIAYDDLVQIGLEAMVKAAKTFHPAIGSFTTHSSWQMFRDVNRELGESGGIVRYPNDLYVQLVALRRAIADVHSQTGDEPTPQALAAHLSRPGKTVTPEDIAELLPYMRPAIYLDAPLSYASDLTTYDRTPGALDPEQMALERVTASEIRKAVGSLPSADRDLLVQYFGFIDGNPHTQDELAAMYGVSRSTIGNRIRAANAVLRARLGGIALQHE